MLETFSSGGEFDVVKLLNLILFYELNILSLWRIGTLIENVVILFNDNTITRSKLPVAKKKVCYELSPMVLLGKLPRRPLKLIRGRRTDNM